MRRLLVIDTETGGLDPTTHSILSVGGIVWEEGRLVDSFEVFIVEPELVVDSRALQVNQIDLDWHRAHGLSPVDAMKALRFFLERHFGDPRTSGKVPLAGHNVSFDIGFLKRLCRLANVSFEEVFSHRVLDTAGIIRFLVLARKLDLPEASSTEAFKYFGIEVETGMRHTALGDARATATLLNKLIGLVA